ncbi:PAS domain-containing sensor histidine kinase [Sphingobacterium griseoflavum]|nr:PAS domain-containing sensor histidine kinase [Sphingobacterium griseoflavum]
MKFVMYLSDIIDFMNYNIKQILGIIANAPQGIAIYDDADLNIRFVNPAMLAVWGKSDDIVGRKFGDVFPTFTEQGFTDLLLNVWHSGVTYRATAYPAEITIDGKSEIKYFDFEYQAILDESGRTSSILHTSTDVTPRKKALQLLEEQDAMMSFNKELELLTNNLSHDLKNPLGVIKMGAQFMRSKTNMPSSEIHKWCDAILASIGSMESILNHTLRVNEVRLYESSHAYVAMSEVIERVCTEIKNTLDAPSAQFQIGELLPVFGDGSLVQQLFYSVVGNAVRYTTNETVPTISIDSELREGATIYYVKDNGIGIPEDEMANLFELFYRGSNARDFDGTGVGLSLVSKILKRLQGSIHIESKIGEGTTVVLTFPVPKFQS